MWDDKKSNPTCVVGGAFGFVHNFDRVEIHMIVDIHDPGRRLDSWSANVGQLDRNVLYLTPILFTIPWDTWLSLGGARKVQGTSQVVSAHVEETGEIFVV